MIRRGRQTDFIKISDLWLEASLQAHGFVSAKYWRDMKESVIQHYLPNTETFVFVDKHQIKGFISIADKKHVGALFVAPKFQNHKIGHKLLKYTQRKYPLLSLNVFAKNRRALSFYMQNGFKIVAEKTEFSTQELELQMCWGLGCRSGFCKKHHEDS